MLFVALGVAVAALAVVLVMEFTGGGGARQAVPAAYQVYSSGESTEMLASREDDPRPLAESEVFERGNEKIDSQGLEFTLTAKALDDTCANAVWGDALVAALEEADCTQVARGGYTSADHVGVAAMFKLRDTEAAQAVAAAMELPEGEEAEPSGFLVPPSTDEPFDKLGSGYSAAEATVNGHYLVVTWVQPLASTSPEEREDLTSPLIALGNFDFPLYRRVLERESVLGVEGGAAESSGAEAGTTGTDAAPGTEGGTLDGTGTEVPVG
ncbi:hypothetical protein ACQEU5_00420 [Marinactinospora thermotolerans]|uniref:Uncharacterized protein n=1 Tax=Marinactinospora thermotolerans DSM 45154 TaxID=1122192 RepID=A0A1T4KRE3_9ACTN|nr:hypothetical protein [Marinactinospora thermotolerans]SJZ44982.1 hypothetical protein SAMN02745673_00505 [Marinactinospora thermotolerans DSM 45154]